MLNKIFNPLTLFIVSCVFLVFLWGFSASQFAWFPSAWLRPALEHAIAVEQAATHRHFVHPARHDFAGVRTERPVVDDEVVLLASYWMRDGELLPELRAIDTAGEVLHAWRIDIPTIWPESPHQDGVAGFFNHANNYAHGVYLFDNGDVLFNIEYLGLVRMNARGEVVWRLDRRTHHSIHRSDNGNFWVCGARWVDDPHEVLRRFTGLLPPITEDLALEVTPDGEVVQEVSVLEVFWKSEYRDKLWTQQRRTADLLHLNDVEPLSATMADQYPLFEAGDLVVSLRMPDVVMVFDPKTGAIKWSADRPHMGQHDPDFIGDGWISVFDNHADGSNDGVFLGGSKLIAFRPHTGEVKTIYPRPEIKDERRFYTSVGGKAQQLRSGNWLIIESTAGRLFEIDGTGRTVWEWGHERQPDGMIAEVLGGSRYPISRERVTTWTR